MTTQISTNLIKTPFRGNTIINGNFDVWQRGTSFPAAVNGYCADRFLYNILGAAVQTVAQSTDVPTYAESGMKSNYSLLMDVTTADVSITTTDYSAMVYTIEGYDYAQIVGGNATLSFWVKGTKTGIYCIGFRNGNTDRSYIMEYTIDVTDTWEKKTLTVPLTENTGTWDYTNGKGLTIFFTVAAGPTLHTTANAWQTGNFIATSNQVNGVDNIANNFRIAQVQFEKGSVATPHQPALYADELAKCQRYFIYMTGMAVFGYQISGGTIMTTVNFPTQMRAIPTCTLVSSGTSSNATSITFYAPSINAVGYGVNIVSTSGGGSYGAIATIDAEL